MVHCLCCGHRIYSGDRFVELAPQTISQVGLREFMHLLCYEFLWSKQ